MCGFYSGVYLTFSFFLCIGVVSYSQSGQADIVYYEYDKIVGNENTGLYNGPEFVDQFLDTWDNSHIYLKSSAFMKSRLVYNNQSYINVPLKYDLFEDNVIIRSSDHLSAFQVKLIAENISSFSVHGRTFTKLNGTKLDLIGNDFFEIASLGKSVSLYIKHLKKKKRETVENVLQYSFYKDNYYILAYGGVYHPIYSIKDFKEIFPDKYKQIKIFYKQNKIQYKASKDSFMIKLVKYLDENQSL